MDIKLVGCVILYNPNKNVVQNIKSYIGYLDRLYIIDNSNGSFIYNDLKAIYHNIKYIKFSSNMGIAYPLNTILNLTKDRYNFLLTMDQDSYFSADSMKNYKLLIKNFDWERTLGISPILLNKDNQKVKISNQYAVITSGNIININNAFKIGGYNNKLFIYEVDFEFCYRGYLAGYKSCIITDKVYMFHTLGERRKFKIFNKIVYEPMNYNYIVTYYIIRNLLYVYYKYHNIDEKFFLKKYILSFLKIIISKIIFENDKYRKIKSIIIGIKDFALNNMGKKEFKY